MPFFRRRYTPTPPAAVFFLYPSDPEIQLVRIKLNHIQVDSSNKLLLNLSFSFTIKVRNKAFLSLQYDSLVVSIGYRGRELGFVTSDGGQVKARGSSYVNATLDLNGLEIIHDVIYFLEDLAKGVIPFDTDTKVRGNLELLFFKIPLKARVRCEVFVDVSDQTVSRQNCSSESFSSSMKGINGDQSILCSDRIERPKDFETRYAVSNSTLTLWNMRVRFKWLPEDRNCCSFGVISGRKLKKMIPKVGWFMVPI